MHARAIQKAREKFASYVLKPIGTIISNKDASRKSAISDSCWELNQLLKSLEGCPHKGTLHAISARNG